MHHGGELKEINGDIGCYGRICLELSDCDPNTFTIMTCDDI